jgi:hypothetical protein
MEHQLELEPTANKIWIQQDWRSLDCILVPLEVSSLSGGQATIDAIAHGYPQQFASYLWPVVKKALVPVTVLPLLF